MSEDWVAVAALTFGLLWMIPAYYFEKAAGINHATWRVKQAALADGWDRGVVEGLSWDENQGEDFATQNPYRGQT